MVRISSPVFAKVLLDPVFMLSSRLSIDCSTRPQNSSDVKAIHFYTVLFRSLSEGPAKGDAEVNPSKRGNSTLTISRLPSSHPFLPPKLPPPRTTTSNNHQERHHNVYSLVSLLLPIAASTPHLTAQQPRRGHGFTRRRHATQSRRDREPQQGWQVWRHLVRIQMWPFDQNHGVEHVMWRS